MTKYKFTGTVSFGDINSPVKTDGSRNYICVSELMTTAEIRSFIKCYNGFTVTVELTFHNDSVQYERWSHWHLITNIKSFKVLESP